MDQARRSCGRLIAREGSVTSGDPVRACHSDRLIVRHSRMEPPHLPTENLSINCVRRGGRWSSLVPSHNESSLQRGLIRCVRCISRGDKDSLAEQGGFELPVPRGLLWTEFSSNLAHYSGPNKSICAGENLFARDSALLRISPVPFVRQTDTRNLVTSNARRFGVGISLPGRAVSKVEPRLKPRLM
jgi:hypothetical protein